MSAKLLDLIRKQADVDITLVGDREVLITVSWEGITLRSSVTIHGDFDEFQQSWHCESLIVKTCRDVRQAAIAIAHVVMTNEQDILTKYQSIHQLTTENT